MQPKPVLDRLSVLVLSGVVRPYGSFRKLGVPHRGGPYNTDPTIWGTILGCRSWGTPVYPRT